MKTKPILISISIARSEALFLFLSYVPPARKPLCLLSHLWTLTKLYEPTDYKRQLTVLNKHICFVSVCRLLVTEFLEQMKKTNRREDVPRGYLLEDLDNQEKSIHYEKSWVLSTAYKTPFNSLVWFVCKLSLAWQYVILQTVDENRQLLSAERFNPHRIPILSNSWRGNVHQLGGDMRIISTEGFNAQPPCSCISTILA